MANIETRIESARGCGYRKPGGIYLVGGHAFNSCGMLPIPLTICPCCNAGIKASRGWTWVSKELLITKPCKLEGKNGVCTGCVWLKQEKLGLLWIGESFYATPAAFIAESNMAGVSRRLSNVPKNFVVGETWVVLAHSKAITEYNSKNEPVFTPGAFAIFRPSAIEYIVTGQESPGRLADLEKRGFKLIKVIRDIDTQKTLEDQLVRFDVKYKFTINEVTSVKMQTINASDKKTAREQFKKSFPTAEILSIK